MSSRGAEARDGLTREPELRYTPTDQAMVKFGIAVNRNYVNRNGERVESTDSFNVKPGGTSPRAWRSPSPPERACSRA